MKGNKFVINLYRNQNASTSVDQKAHLETPGSIRSRIRIQSSLDGNKYLKPRGTLDAMTIMNDYAINQNPYSNHINYPAPNVVGSSQLDKRLNVNKTMLGSYDNLASANYTPSMIKNKSITNSQKELINKSYEIKTDILQTR